MATSLKLPMPRRTIRLMLRLVRVGLLASDATTDEETGAAVGDPTEIALVDWGDAHGLREEDGSVLSTRGLQNSRSIRTESS